MRIRIASRQWPMLSSSSTSTEECVRAPTCDTWTRKNIKKRGSINEAQHRMCQTVCSQTSCECAQSSNTQRAAQGLATQLKKRSKTNHHSQVTRKSKGGEQLCHLATCV
eukprot:4696578-Prymnesium_polylepis.1